MLEVNFRFCLFIAVLTVSAECHGGPSLPLSKDSFQLIQRIFIPTPRGRKAELSDIRLKYYRDSVKNHTSYRMQNSVLLLSDPTFERQKPTVIYVGGYLEVTSDSSGATLLEAYIKNGGFNILILDWSNLAFGDYISVLYNIKPVGNEAGKAILKLLKQGLNIQGLHVVGHSMGAHVAAVIARFLKARGYTVPRLTVLDAAYPGFYPPIQTVPINPEDADFVDVIHTDGGWFGASTSIGHVDFWPNDGTAKQPGCLPFTLPLTVENFCNHWRSYWAESVNADNFVARKCDNYDDFLRGNCYGTASMGLAATPDLRGNYYLRTATQEPFALGERGAI
ncbi:pancreatic triacylglycerol lipase-like [Maniola jurtina]|uniref:pancreatic triacylglycerol lipase-like n=1 Tax=Maniola jurtina TaxID=191418 RepID=UPI001E68DA98|nr:pancreatic triacylglycerol lipase-like [Maniola jurtina]